MDRAVCNAAKVHLSSSNYFRQVDVVVDGTVPPTFDDLKIPYCLDGNTIILLPELMYFPIRANLIDERGADSLRRGRCCKLSVPAVFAWYNMDGLTFCALPSTSIFPSLEDLVEHKRAWLHQHVLKLVVRCWRYPASGHLVRTSRVHTRASLAG